MKKNTAIWLMIILTMMLLTACGITQKETTDSGGSAGGDISPTAQWIPSNVVHTEVGTGNIIIDELIFFPYESKSFVFELRREDNGQKLLSKTYTAGDSLSFQLSDSVPENREMRWYQSISHTFPGGGGGSSSSGENEWEFYSPSSSENARFDNIVIVPRFYWQEQYYFDVSEALITSNSAIDWDFYLVSASIDYSPRMTVMKIISNPGKNSELYYIPGSDQFKDMDGYTVEEDMLTKNINYDADTESPMFVYKTDENNFGYFSVWGSSGSTSSGIEYTAIKITSCYFDDGRNQFYDPLEKTAAY